MAATRYIGNAKLTLTLNERNDTYKVSISARGKRLSTQYVGVPAARRGYGVDNPQAYDEAASAAASFEVNDRGPASDVLESGYAADGMGWHVRRSEKRSAARKNAPRSRKPARKVARKNTPRARKPAKAKRATRGNAKPSKRPARKATRTARSNRPRKSTTARRPASRKNAPRRKTTRRAR